MKVCMRCGCADIREVRKVLLKGQSWYVRNDGYRLWVRPAEGNPLLDRHEYPYLEYKYYDVLGEQLAELFFSLDDPP